MWNVRKNFKFGKNLRIISHSRNAAPSKLFLWIIPEFLEWIINFFSQRSHWERSSRISPCHDDRFPESDTNGNAIEADFRYSREVSHCESSGKHKRSSGKFPSMYISYYSITRLIFAFVLDSLAYDSFFIIYMYCKIFQFPLVSI